MAASRAPYGVKKLPLEAALMGQGLTWVAKGGVWISKYWKEGGGQGRAGQGEGEGEGSLHGADCGVLAVLPVRTDLTVQVLPYCTDQGGNSREGHDGGWSAVKG